MVKEVLGSFQEGGTILLAISFEEALKKKS